MKIRSRYYRLSIYKVKRTTNKDGMGPFKKYFIVLECSEAGIKTPRSEYKT